MSIISKWLQVASLALVALQLPAQAEIVVQGTAAPDYLEPYATPGAVLPGTARVRGAVPVVPYAPGYFAPAGTPVYNVSGIAVRVPVIVPNASWYSGGGSNAGAAPNSMFDRMYVNDRNASRARAYSMDLYKQK